MSKLKKLAGSLSAKVKTFSRSALSVIASIPSPSWGRVGKAALAVSAAHSRIKQTSKKKATTKKENGKKNKSNKKTNALKKMLRLLKQKSRYGRMYTNARKLSSERKQKERVQEFKTMLLQATVSKPPTKGHEIDLRTGDCRSDFYSRREVLGNLSSNLKPYVEMGFTNFFTEFFFNGSKKADMEK